MYIIKDLDTKMSIIFGYDTYTTLNSFERNTPYYLTLYSFIDCRPK